MGDPSERVRTYAFMRLARLVDLRFSSLLKTGRLSKWYSQVGAEATTVVSGLALEAGDVLSTLHRDMGAILSVYLDPARTFPGFGFGEPDGHRSSAGYRRPEPGELLYRLCCQLMGREDGFSRGVERSFHYGYLAPEQGIRHLGLISHLGAMIPVAAGSAFALKQAGGDRLAITFIGDGGTSTGDFHEGLNMAAVWKLPLILVIENNHYAFSTPVADQYAAEKLSDRGVGYGVAAETVDGNDPDELREALGRAVRRARAGEGPTLLEAALGRMRGHSEGDDSLKVVPADELDRYMAEDPVPAYARRLEEEEVLSAEVRERLDARASELVEEAVERAAEAADPAVETAFRAVFMAAGPPPPEDETPIPEGDVETYVEGVHQALAEEMERDESVLLLGQDIARFEGAFRTTRGLWRRWPERVRDTPIAESGTLGIAAGAALLGYRPVVEMQFGDFISCGFNQMVNVIAKLFYRFEAPVPLVVRLPVGGGAGAGPFHSQNPEAWFTHTAGLKVVAPATAEDAKLLLKAAIRDPDPVVFCEHKFLYRRIKAVLPPADRVGVLGRAKVLRRGTDLTLVAYGAATWTCLEAARELEKEGVSAEVVDLRTLVPLDEETVLSSVAKTSRALVVHEAPLTGGFGGELAARIAEKAFPWLDAPVRRVASADRPSPFVKALEQALLPTRDKVVDAARELLRF